MGYYGTGDYYGVGDPGFFGFLGKVAKKAIGFIPGVGPVASLAIDALGGASRGLSGSGLPQLQIPTGTAVAKRAGGAVDKFGQPRRRRRMNVTNDKALRRAIRRQAGFVKLAKKALKGSGYQIVTKGSRRSVPRSIRESGPGNVIVR